MSQLSQPNENEMYKIIYYRKQHSISALLIMITFSVIIIIIIIIIMIQN